MTDIVKGMVTAFYSSDSFSSEDAMRAALLWLANNVSDEMVAAHWKAFYFDGIRDGRQIFAAAIRAAAGEEGK